ncbi:alcohol acetyltransferase [Mycena galopus ATCC 62051]|nr:alcohol acetyltransferase [Mycena galopus ATCC 62051]
MGTTSPTFLRNVGLVESWHITRHFLGLDSCVLVSARYTSVDGTILSKEHLFSALRKVIQTHPILSVMLQNEDSKPSFIRLEKIELPRVVQFSDHNDLEVAIQLQLSTRFDTAAQLPLWRVEVLNDGTVLVAYHHGIGDGLSGVAFHRSLLAALQDVGDDSPVVEVSQPLSLLPPIEGMTSLWPSLSKIISEVLSLVLPASWQRSYYAWNANPVSKTQQFTPHVKLFTFSGEEMAAFAKICRSHSATVTSALYVLAASVLSRSVPPHSPEYKTLTAVVAISLRSVAGASSDVLCDYVSGHRSYPPINPAFQWPAAARYATELQRQKTAAREEIGIIYLIASNFGGFMKGMLGGKRRATFELSNAGRVPAVDGVRLWRAERMVFAQSDLVIGAALKINVIGDPTGAVNVALTWGEEAIDRDVVESFATQFQEGLRALLV